MRLTYRLKYAKNRVRRFVFSFHCVKIPVIDILAIPLKQNHFILVVYLVTTSHPRQQERKISLVMLQCSDDPSPIAVRCRRPPLIIPWHPHLVPIEKKETKIYKKKSKSRWGERVGGGRRKKIGSQEEEETVGDGEDEKSTNSNRKMMNCWLKDVIIIINRENTPGARCVP